MAGAALLVCGVLLGACERAAGGDGGGGAGAGGGEAAKSLKVVATVGMIADVVRNVAGERAEVTGLLGAGVDPHLYRPTRTDIATLLAADVVFYNGLLLEGKMTDTLVRVAAAGKKVVPVTERIEESFLLDTGDGTGHEDPHVWMDPAAWMKTVEVIRDTLIAADPDGRGAYERNAAEYGAALKAMDARVEALLKGVPEGQRVLVTAHDAFNYFGRRYGYEVVGIQGISTESEAGVKDVERLVELLVSRKVKAVFVESTVSDRNINALIEGARARGHAVVIGGSLFSDAMGPEGTAEGTYIGMVEANARTIAGALGEGSANVRERESAKEGE